ncbi:hypothetical protein DFJ74DRAFT_660575 [Hyaloraphidium curvatum]|nr:hypothetical protein DFJ74DRAFT_660575 [Hyaloraphidium curvatum]
MMSTSLSEAGAMPPSLAGPRKASRGLGHRRVNSLSPKDEATALLTFSDLDLSASLLPGDVCFEGELVSPALPPLPAEPDPVPRTSPAPSASDRRQEPTEKVTSESELMLESAVELLEQTKTVLANKALRVHARSASPALVQRKDPAAGSGVDWSELETARNERAVAQSLASLLPGTWQSECSLPLSPAEPSPLVTEVGHWDLEEFKAPLMRGPTSLLSPRWATKAATDPASDKSFAENEVKAEGNGETTSRPSEPEHVSLAGVFEQETKKRAEGGRTTEDTEQTEKERGEAAAKPATPARAKRSIPAPSPIVPIRTIVARSIQASMQSLQSVPSSPVGGKMETSLPGYARATKASKSHTRKAP